MGGRCRVEVRCNAEIFHWEERVDSEGGDNRRPIGTFNYPKIELEPRMRLHIIRCFTIFDAQFSFVGAEKQ